MKRLFLLILILCFVACKLTQAQTITIAGHISDDHGNPVPFAFIQNMQNGTYTDSTGSFSLKANPNSILLVNFSGYKDTVFNIGNNTSFQLTLKPVGSRLINGGDNILLNSNANTNASNSGPNFSKAVQGDLYLDAGTLRASAKQKENVHGSRYLFDDWVHGYVTNPSDTLVQNAAYLFNYDKIGGGLLLTQDGKSIIQINSTEIKSFTLFDNTTKPYLFEKEAAINPTHYIQVLSSGLKYKIYKAISTKFIKSDYTTNGFVSKGNNYDEFVDEATYFVLDRQTNQLQKLSLKKKSISEVFIKDTNKVNKYIEANSGDIDDTYLQNLGDALNN